MREPDRLFESERGRLHAVAYRILGSAAEAEDAVQETWLRVARTDMAAIETPAAWLTTVVSRICLDMLRTRAARREDFLDGDIDPRRADSSADPEHEAVLADSVGRALLIVLETLGPAERVAFVLHDMFAVPFDLIAPVVGRGTAATKKLASRARGRVGVESSRTTVEFGEQRRVVEAFLAAAREGDLAGLVAVLAPDVVRSADPAALPAASAAVLRGARAVAEETALLRDRARTAAVALVEGAVGIIVAEGTRMRLALRITVTAGRISSYEVIADPARLRALEIAILPE
ncbi:sigma-70 family RNA polymerase sigma factor [Nocardia bovistercoris]|uniref:Sigma-70 family RNA polymerase sigma factor n=1 Tax=Nocardia bovistercoris TaxID=2785916 RepID=A0A931IDJ6_9NOCA|nr:sigma-70 family RNA polymerase sigma factor [Nocardia bovistercoris]